MFGDDFCRWRGLVGVIADFRESVPLRGWVGVGWRVRGQVEGRQNPQVAEKHLHSPAGRWAICPCPPLCLRHHVTPLLHYGSMVLFMICHPSVAE